MLTPQAVRQVDRLALAVLMQAVEQAFSWTLHFIGSAVAGCAARAPSKANPKTIGLARRIFNLNDVMVANLSASRRFD
jgi:hypothetical protein